MDIVHAEKNADRFHKTVLLLVSRMADVPVGLLEPENKITTFPFVIRSGGNLDFFVYGKKGGNMETDFITPYIVNASFALELYFKVLIYLETNNFVRTHKLDDLYVELSLESQEFLSDNVQQITKNSDLHRQCMNHINNQSTIQFSWDIDKLIKESSEAFVHWRYAHEGNNGWFAGYKEIRDSLIKRIELLKSK